MNVYRAIELDPQGTRSFPWSQSQHDARCRYYDFKKQPDLIPTVLEDFVAWSSFPAIQTFFDFLRWLNSPTSELETDDCAFSGIHPNSSPRFAKAEQADGRVMVFFRQLENNCIPQTAQWLLDCFSFYIQRTARDLQYGCVGLSRASVTFSQIAKQGQSLVLHFWAWGDSDDEVMQNLQRLFADLSDAAKKVSRDIAGANQRPRTITSD